MTVTVAPTDIPRISPRFRLQWEEAQGCHVLLYPEGMVKLNGPAGEILRRCDGARSVDAIVHDLASHFADAPGLRDDVYRFLSTAHDQQWIRFDT